MTNQRHRMLYIEKQFVNSTLMSNYLVYECKM